MTEPAVSRGRSASGYVVAAGLAFFALVMAYFAFGMPGMDHGTPTADPEGYEAVDAETFAARLHNGDPFVVNVHVPFAGEIEGTDEHIPSDRVATSAALPGAMDAEILVYCRTGSMSTDAAEAFVARGYTNVSVLRGGMDAWREAGNELEGVD